MIHVIVSDFNGWAQTRLCLDALRRSRYRTFCTIVVDHGTSAETSEGLSAQYREVVRLRGDPELWWTGATNLGIRAARARGAQSVILLNNDCYLAPDTISCLAAYFDPSAPAVIAPLQRRAHDGRLLTNWATSCFALGFPTLPLPATGFRPGEQRQIRTNLIMGGRGVLVPVEVFDRIGLFDEERLPHYGADHDFFLRCRRKGVPMYLALDAFVDVDDTRTTLASKLGSMSVRQFLATFTDRRSHRNIRMLSVLFRLHYPIRGLHFVGVTLNVARYVLSYLLRRILFLARSASSVSRF